MKIISYLEKPSVVPDHVQNILIQFLAVDNTSCGVTTAFILLSGLAYLSITQCLLLGALQI